MKRSFDEVLRDIKYRDEQDSHRAAAPLKMAEDAIAVDTSELNFDESLELVVKIIRQKLGIGAEDK